MYMNKRCCLTEGFFSQLDTVYENCYRINPNPSETFLDRMQLIEIQARRLRDQLEEIQADSYRYLEPKKITDEERTMLQDYDHSGLIVKAFMPYISMAFCLTASNPEVVNSINSLDMSFVENLLSIKDLAPNEPNQELKYQGFGGLEIEQEIEGLGELEIEQELKGLGGLGTLELDSVQTENVQAEPIGLCGCDMCRGSPANKCYYYLKTRGVDPIGVDFRGVDFRGGIDPIVDPLIELPEEGSEPLGMISELPEVDSVSFNHPVRSIYHQLPMNSTSNPEVLSDEVLIPEVILSFPASQASQAFMPCSQENQVALESAATSGTSFEFQDDSKYQNFEEDFEQLIKNTCLNWKDIQSCYPDSSIVMFLQQVSGSAEIRFNKDFNPVLHVKSLKGNHHYEYELNEYAFKYDIDSILSETVVDQLQNLVDDLEA